MMHRRLSLAVFALSALVSLPASAQDASTVVATVNGKDITLGHMIVAGATLPQQYQQLPDEVLFNGILDQLIQQSALAQAHTADLPLRIPLAIENETRSLTAAEAIEAILATAVTPEAVQAIYDEKYATTEPGTEYNASHILVETEEEAQAIIDELENGADFAATAREKSTGPSGPSGGSLGWFGTGMMVAPFEEAVVALEVGAISAPVETQFGWHVIKLNETRAEAVPGLEEVRAEVEEEVRQNAVRAAIEALLAETTVDRSGAEGVDPALLRDLSLVD